MDRIPRYIRTYLYLIDAFMTEVLGLCLPVACPGSVLVIFIGQIGSMEVS